MDKPESENVVCELLINELHRFTQAFNYDLKIQFINLYLKYININI